jgi:hypothetical protein
LLERDAEREALVKQLSVGTLQCVDDIERKAISAKSDDVQTKQFGTIALGNGERRNILGGHTSTPNHSAASNAAVLVYSHETAKDYIVFHHNVSGDVCGVCKCAVVSDCRIMGNMAVGHEKIVIPDDGGPTLGTPVDRRAFSEDVALSHREKSVFARIFFVLRISTDGRIRKHLTPGAEGGGAADGCMSANCDGATKGDISANDGVGAKNHIVGELCGVMDDGCGMDRHMGVLQWPPY